MSNSFAEIIMKIVAIYDDHSDEETGEWDSGNDIAEEVHNVLIRHGYMKED